MSKSVPVIDRPQVLIEGDRLDQRTFHACYEAMPTGTRAELIGGVVFMPGPVGRSHGQAHAAVIFWLSDYAEGTPGVEVLDNATTILGTKSEPQPDALLRVLPENGGQTVTERGYIRGAPELIAEISQTTRYVDLGPKLADYEQAGVREYIVRGFKPDDVHWFEQVQGALVEKPVDADGLYRSRIFPGLWLDPDALVRGDTRRLRAVLDEGLATPEHAAHVVQLKTRGGP